VAILAARTSAWGRLGLHGKFTDHPGYDESRFADIAARKAGVTLHQTTITAQDFRDSIKDVVYHLDHPIAGPGSFPQYMMSALAAKHVKVVLGGQGGDEVFGGYARYLIAYFEQCLKAAIAGGYSTGSFAVSAESMIPHLSVLREYEPLLRKFFAKGLFGPLDERYLALIDRASDVTNEIDWSSLDRAGVIDRYRDIFNASSNARAGSQFDSMMHFDFKCLLPALLHVEDRMSMAHGLEARVPLLDSKLIEFAATVPAQIKLKDGQLKHLLKATFANELPVEIADRRDKMGFPVPLNEWFAGPLKEFTHATFASQRARQRPYVNSRAILANFEKGERFSRKAWGLLNLEIWQQLFHDRAGDYRRMIDQAEHRRLAAE
jgi:asparagine synthase (glutamine-hydrolysing)